MTDQREPTLEDILNEPIIQQVMLSDGVSADDIRLLMRTAAARQNRGADSLVVTCYAQAPLFARTATAA
jgi:hypothetical protein